MIYAPNPLSSVSFIAARNLYFDDKVVAALELAESDSGNYMGFYRILEGEARTRSNSQQAPLTPRLTLEWVPEEVPNSEAVGAVVRNAAAHVRSRLKWDEREKVLATILVAEADADWNDARYGYCVDKNPYDKICLPLASTADLETLFRVAAHEYAHVVTLNLTQNAAPHWLDEGLACLMEGRSAKVATDQLRKSNTWLTPLQMHGIFEVDRRDSSSLYSVSLAYSQATTLVAWLYKQKGDEGLTELLAEFTQHSLWTDLMIRLSNREPVEEALDTVYGLSQHSLFERAQAWDGFN